LPWLPSLTVGLLTLKEKTKLNPCLRTPCLLTLLLISIGFSAQAQTPSPTATPSATPTPTPNQLTPAQLLSLRTISDPRFSPDGQYVAFVVTEPVKGTTRARHIWLLDVKTKEVRQFTNSSKNEDTPRWSPDGKRLAFISNRDDARQIYVIQMNGGEAKRLLETKHEIDSFSWSPDGKQIAFFASEPKTAAEEQKDKDKDDARVVDRDDRLRRLWLLDPVSARVRQVTSGRWRVSEAEWLPTGAAMIASATDHPESDQETNRIYSINLADGKLTEIAAPRGPFGRLRVSPDGTKVVYIAAPVDGPSTHDLFLLTLADGKLRNLTSTSLDRPVLNYSWGSNDVVAATVQNGFSTSLVPINVIGEVNPAAKLPVNPRGFDISNSMVAVVGSSAAEPEELWLWDANKNAQRVSDFNKSLRQLTILQPETFRYKSFDGLEIEGRLIKPKGYVSGARVPLIALIHGGPTSAWLDSIESWGQLLAARGFAIFYPNVRGSTGYGHKFVEMNRADWGGGDYKDVMAGVDYLIAQGVADPQRLGIGGWSYGGYMSEWAITQTTRFKAAVSGAGLSNLASEFGTEDGSSYDQWFFGVPYENLDGFMKSSPIKYLKNAKTPTLILQGEADRTDPIGQSQELYRGLKYYGVEAELVFYPREGHGLTEEKHLIDRLNRIVAWYEKHLK
jgi:dipeptidyl aminopeptidase/acylaminoacyl peptidase